MKSKTNLTARWWYYTILSLLCLIFCSQLNAQNDDTTECPYFNVFSTDSSGVDFALLSTSVDATISGVIANVIVEQTYTNPGDSTLDATYVFPMSTQAAIYGMEMDVNDRTIKAEIRRKEEAQSIFENADSLGITTSLLEQERPNVFQMSLANINSGDTIKVRMVYTELLTPEKGIYQFVFPNIVGPRFTLNGESWINQSIADSSAVSNTTLDINLKINAGMSVEANCTSHAANFINQGNTSQTELSTNPGDDFIVNYTLDDGEIETGLLLYEGEDENFFLSMIQPPRPDIEYDSPQREYIFIMDISGSMWGQPIETSKQMMINLLNDLNHDDKFNIIFFAGGSSVLAPQSLSVTNENINLATEMIESFQGGGGTQLLPALERALGMEGSEEFSRTFVILTDGYVAVEKEAYELIRQNLNEANFFAFGIGESVNRYIIEGIAYVGEGESFVITDGNDADETAKTFKEYIEHPVLTNIEATFNGIEVYDIEPLTIPDVFAERPIIIYGKYHKPASGELLLEGEYAAGTVTSTLNFEDYTSGINDNIALKYLWARKRIKLMSDYGIASNETDTISIEEEITRLGLKYSLITEFTSFVAVDSSAVSTANDDTDSGDTGDELVDVEYIDHPLITSSEIIIVLGTINRSKEILKLKINGVEFLDLNEHSIAITDMNGHSTIYNNLTEITTDDVLSIRLGDWPDGIYTISLHSKNGVIDSEKFIIINR